MTDHDSRRAFLTAAATACGIVLAGCSSGADSEATTTPSDTPTETTGASGDGTPTAGASSGDTPTPTEAADGSSGGFGGSLDDVENYDGSVADRTGESEVRIGVGAEGNGGAFAFAPAAVRISTGTTVVWEWTGEGGQHNVVAESGASFESDMTDEAGFTFEQAVEEPGTVTYYCAPHRSLGMKGGVVVE